jgi:hypothetical protein
MKHPLKEVQSMSKSPHPHTERRSLHKAFAANLSGTSLEWYDFAVYRSAAALVFGDLLFPTSDPLTGTLGRLAVRRLRPQARVRRRRRRRRGLERRVLHHRQRRHGVSCCSA